MVDLLGQETLKLRFCPSAKICQRTLFNQCGYFAKSYELSRNLHDLEYQND